MIYVVPLALGMGCCLAVFRSAIQRDKHPLALSLILTINFLVANVAWKLNGLWVLPFLDLMLVSSALLINEIDEGNSSRIFLDIVYIRMAAHLVGAVFGVEYVVPYIHLLNATFACMVLVVLFWNKPFRTENMFDHIVSIFENRKLATSGVNAK